MALRYPVAEARRWAVSRYLVTGAAGFIGSHLCERLLAAGHAVAGIDSFADYYPRELKEANIASCRRSESFRLTEGDVAQCDLASMLAEVDGVFHLAAQAGVRGSWGDTFDVYLSDNLLSTQRLFEAALARDVRIVFASSSSVYGNSEHYPTTEDVPLQPISPYGVTKLACEHLASSYLRRGLDVIGLRYFTVYGPRQRPDMAYTRIAKALLEHKSFTIYGTGAQSRDVTFVQDAVAATELAMERGVSGRMYNVGGGSETTLLKAINVFEKVCNATLCLDRVDVAAGDVHRTAGCTAMLENDTGWTASIDLLSGVRAHAAWAEEAISLASSR